MIAESRVKPTEQNPPYEICRAGGEIINLFCGVRYRSALNEPIFLARGASSLVIELKKIFGGRTRTRTLDPLIKSQKVNKQVQRVKSSQSVKPPADDQ
jgi:hypothetical protein